jgi:hypothetical protein
MNMNKKGIKLLMFFYCFIIFQHFLMRPQLKMSAGVEAVLIGTLIYLVIGFFKKIPASRWAGILFHGVFQVMETISVIYLLNPKVFAALVKELPANTAGIARSSLFLVFGLITAINISAIVYLWKQREYFTGSRTGAEEPGI